MDGFSFVSKKLLRRDTNGRILYFPHGKNRGSYVLTETQLKDITAYLNKVTPICIIIAVLAQRFSSNLFFLVVFAIIIVSIYIMLLNRKLSAYERGRKKYADLKPY